MVRVRKRPHPKKPRLFVVAVHGADISKQGKKAHAFVDEMEAMIRSVVEAEGYDTLRVAWSVIAEGVPSTPGDDV